jgi:hypothetical protein
MFTDNRNLRMWQNEDSNPWMQMTNRQPSFTPSIVPVSSKYTPTVGINKIKVYSDLKGTKLDNIPPEGEIIVCGELFGINDFNIQNLFTILQDPRIKVILSPSDIKLVSSIKFFKIKRGLFFDSLKISLSTADEIKKTYDTYDGYILDFNSGTLNLNNYNKIKDALIKQQIAWDVDIDTWPNVFDTNKQIPAVTLLETAMDAIKSDLRDAEIELSSKKGVYDAALASAGRSRGPQPDSTPVIDAKAEVDRLENSIQEKEAEILKVKSTHMMKFEYTVSASTSNPFKNLVNLIIDKDLVNKIIIECKTKTDISSENDDSESFMVMCIFNRLFSKLSTSRGYTKVNKIKHMKNAIPTSENSTDYSNFTEGLLYELFNSDQTFFCHHYNMTDTQYLFSNGGLSDMLLKTPSKLHDYYKMMNNILNKSPTFECCAKNTINFTFKPQPTIENAISDINRYLKTVVREVLDNQNLCSNIIYLFAISHEFKCKKVSVFTEKCTSKDQNSSEDSSSELSPMFTNSKQKTYDIYYKEPELVQIFSHKEISRLPYVQITGKENKIVLVNLSGTESKSSILDIDHSTSSAPPVPSGTSSSTVPTTPVGPIRKINVTLTSDISSDEYKPDGATTVIFDAIPHISNINIDISKLLKDDILSNLLKHSSSIYYNGSGKDSSNDTHIFTVKTHSDKPYLISHLGVINSKNSEIKSMAGTNIDEISENIRTTGKNLTAMFETIIPGAKDSFDLFVDTVANSIKQKGSIVDSSSSSRTKYLKYKNKYLALKKQLGLQ